MASITDLRMRGHMRHAYILLIAGVPFAFTDERALTSGWWNLDDRRILRGMTLPESLTISLDREAGLIEENSVDFQLLDADGTIPGFFGGLEKTYQRLGERLPASSDPILAPLIGEDQDLINAHEGGYLGTEAIGPNGERNYYSATPWAGMPGQDHPAFDDPRVVFTTRDTGPLIVEGRRVALYRIVYDPDTGTWPDFDAHMTAAIAGNYSPMLWWGTLRQAGRVEGRTWTITCAGPGSWIRRSLATRVPTAWYPVTAGVQFAANERKVTLFFYKTSVFYTGFTYASDGASYQIPDGSQADVVAYLANAIATVSNQAGPDGVWTDDHPLAGTEGVIQFNENGCTVATLKNKGWAARMDLILHFKVWRLLGYDPAFSPGSLDGPQPFFTESDDGYWMGTFSTTPAGKDPFNYDGTPEWSGQGIPRQFTPLYDGGVSVISGMGGQVVNLVPTDNSDIYVEGQTVRPVGAGEIDGEDTDAQRWWLFKGPIQRVGQEEPEDTYQIAVCSWRRQANGAMLINPDGVSRGLFVHEWLDPRLFGLEYEPIDPVVGWASNNGADEPEAQIQASPLSVFGVYHKRTDKVHHTILRTLISTGTAVWDGTFNDMPDSELYDDTLLQGENSTGLDLPFASHDCEIFDMSLQIPNEMLDLDSFFDVAEDLEGGSAGPLALGKVAINGAPIQSEELLAALMSSRGWSLSMKRGKLGLFAAHKGSEGKFQEGIDFEVTESDLHGTPGDPASVIPSVELKPVNAFDRLMLNHTGSPVEGWLSGQVERQGRARDIGARARSGTVTRDVSGPDLISRPWFVGDKSGKTDKNWIKSWTLEFGRLWEKEIASWLAQPHRLIEGLRISRPKGQDIYPGAILRLTNPWPANSTGGYGFTDAFARVLSVTHETASCACVVDCLVEAQLPNALRWAPVLRLVDAVADDTDRYDAAERTFYVQPWGGSNPPLPAFLKPPTLDAPDEPAKVVGLQFDGVDWSDTFSFFAESANLIGNTIKHTASGLTGVFFPRLYTVLVLAPVDDPEQAEWVRRLYAQHTSLPAANTVPKLPA